MTHGRRIPIALTLSFAVLMTGCREDRRGPADLEDTIAPVLIVASLTPDTYDPDGDGFLEINASFSDSESGIDLESIRVRSLEGVNGTATSDDNLVRHWAVARLDSTGLSLEENLEQLLHNGVNRLEVSVGDRAGNRVVDTVAVELPAAKLIRTLRSGYVNQFITDAVLCDDGLIYMTPGNAIMVVDPDQLIIRSFQLHPYYVGTLRFMVCPPGDSMVYVTPHGYRFNRKTQSWLQGSFIPGGYDGIALSRQDPFRIFAGVNGSGTLVELRAGQTNEVRQLPIPISISERENVPSIALLGGDRKLYMTRIQEGGLLVVDPGIGELLKIIKLSGPAWAEPGRAGGIALSSDDRTLYVAITDGDPRGVAVIDTRTDEIRNLFSLEEYRVLDLALSPSGKRLFVTTTERFPGTDPPSSNVLINAMTGDRLIQFTRTRQPGEPRWDSAVVFRPDGKLIFAGHNLDISVYLNRE